MISSTIKVTISNWMQKTRIPEPARVGAAAMLVGLLSGVGIWIFKKLIEWTQFFAFEKLGGWLNSFGNWTVFLIPVLGGLLVGLLVHFWVGKERYQGIPGVIEACALAGGRLPFRKMPLRVLAAALSIGSGASVGPEDPSVQIGTNIGSLVGQVLHLTEDRTRALVAGGAAGGIAAAFNAPIAGVFFALEVVLGEISSSSFGFAAISAVTSAVFTQAVSGNQPAFSIPPYTIHSGWELPVYLILGLLAGPLAAAYIRLIFLARNLFERLNWPSWLKPVLAGGIIGITGIFLPQVFGVGYPTIGSILNNTPFSLWLLLALLLAKLIMTPVSIGGGFMGGVFAPSLFLGATLGGAVGAVANALFPALDIPIPSFAMVGMAAVLASTVHAPLTAILLLFEMTHDYRIMLPLMFAVAVSLTVSRQLQKDSVYQHALTIKGIQLDNLRDIDVLESMVVEEIMTLHPETLHDDEPVSFAFERMKQTHHTGMPVMDENDHLVGILSMQDMQEVMNDSGRMALLQVGELCTHKLFLTYPDESLAAALRKMSIYDVGRLPVVNREDPSILMGLLRRPDVIRAYDIAMARRTARIHRTQQVRLGYLSGAEVHEIPIEPGSICEGRKIQDIHWPRSMVISSIRHGQTLVLPHGDTLLHPGDVLVVVTEENGLAETKRLCTLNR